MKFKPYSQEELNLFPIDVYDEIPKDDICPFINDIVNLLDLSEFESIYISRRDI